MANFVTDAHLTAVLEDTGASSHLARFKAVAWVITGNWKNQKLKIMTANNKQVV